MAGKITKESIQKLKTFFLENTISFSDLAENSRDVCGIQVSLADIKMYSRNDSEGPWSVLKANRGLMTKDVPVQEKLVKVADKLYEMIINEEDPVPGNAIAQLAKTWSEMLVKANMNKEISAKTSPQAVKDIFAEMEAKERERLDGD